MTKRLLATLCPILSFLYLITFHSPIYLMAEGIKLDQLILDKNYVKAREILNKRKSKCDDNQCLAEVEIYLARVEIKEGNKEKASSLLHHAYGLIKGQDGIYNIESAKISSKIGDIMRGELYSFKESIVFYQHALDIYQNGETIDSIGIITSLNDIGLSYVFEGEFKKAEEIIIHALEIALKIPDLNPLILHNVYANLGTLYTKTIKYDLAEKHLTKAIEVWENGELPDSLVEVANTYRQLSYVVSGKGYYSEAVILAKKALYIFEKKFGENSEKLISPCLDISWSYELQGEFEEALQYTGRALALVKLHYNPNHHYMASALSGLGHIYFKMHRNEDAVEYYIKVLQIDSIENPTLDQPVVAVDFHRLGLAYKALNRSREALTLINKTLEIQEKRFGKQSLRLINTINNVGAVYSDLKLYDSARFYFTKALGICEINEEKSILDLINIHKNMTETYNRESNYDLALEEINMSLSYMDIHTGEDGRLIIPEFEYIRFKENLMYILRNRSTALLGLYNEGRNTDYILLAYENHLLHRKIYEYSIKNSVAKGSQLYQASAIAQSNEEAMYILYELYQNTRDIKYILEAWQLSEKSKAILLSKTINEKNLKQIAGIPEELLEEEKRLKKQLSKFYVDYANLNFKINDKKDSTFIAYQKEFFDEKSAYESFIKDLEKNYPAYFELTHFEHVVSVEQLKPLLQKNREAIVEYVEGIDRLYAFVITEEDYHFIPINGKDSLKNAAKNMRIGLLEKDFILYANNAFYLYQHYFKPVEAILSKKGISNLTIIPDNYLGFIPFDALISKEPKGKAEYNKLSYLLYDYNFTYAYSSTVKYQNEFVVHKKVDGLLAFAPEFTEQASTAVPTRNAQTMTSLPFASKEVEDISLLFKGKSLLGLEATEENFKKNAENYSVIHLATHAIMDDNNPELSRLYFQQSGDSLENNVLHAYEIYNMQLNADLITLSACNTGVGKIYKGEGIASLGRAFMYAGCPNILLSLWAVSDKSTSEIMTKFYENLKEGVPKSEALKRSKIAYLSNADANTSDPFFWAAFAIIGSNDPLKTRNNNTRIYIILFSSLFLFIGSYFYFKRKRSLLNS